MCWEATGCKELGKKGHFIRDLIRRGLIRLNLIGTTENAADGLTKALDMYKFAEFVKMLGLRDI